MGEDRIRTRIEKLKDNLKQNKIEAERSDTQNEKAHYKRLKEKNLEAIENYQEEL